MLVRLEAGRETAKGKEATYGQRQHLNLGSLSSCHVGLTNVVVLAADSVGGAVELFSVSLVPRAPQRNNSPSVGAADADNVDCRAGEPDEGVHVLGVDAKSSEDGSDGDAVCGLHGLAALEGPGSAGSRTVSGGGRGAVRRRGGDGKDCEGGKGGEGGGELGEHGEAA